MAVDWIGFLYATAISAGGIVGYSKAGSIPSLGAGLLFGGAIAYGAYQASQTPASHMVILSTSAVLMGVMGARYYHSGKFMPVGLVTLMSAAMVIRYTAKSLGFFLEHPRTQ